jgi:hypothetical protein
VLGRRSEGDLDVDGVFVGVVHDGEPDAVVEVAERVVGERGDRRCEYR